MRGAQQTLNADESLELFVDVARYPIGDVENSERAVWVESCRQQLAASGCAKLEGFILPTTVKHLVSEVGERLSLADRINLRQNPYFTDEDGTLPEDHPARRFESWQNLTVCRDRFTNEDWMDRLFQRVELLEFSRDCLGLPQLYHYADPMAGYIVNIVEDRGAIPWHFDTNGFSISVILQVPEEGGVFEFAPFIRSVEAQNYDAVSSVLDGSKERVIELPGKPGDLLIFMGRDSLHRVNEVKGPMSRYSAIFGYTEQPNIIATAQRRLRHFGRCHEVHLEAERAQAASGAET